MQLHLLMTVCIFFNDEETYKDLILNFKIRIIRFVLKRHTFDGTHLRFMIKSRYVVALD